MADELMPSLEGRIQQLGQVLQALVRDYAPNHLKGAIFVQVFMAPTRFTLSIRVENSAPVHKYGTADARAQEFGSGPNSVKSPTGEITIVPVNHTYLVFEGTNDWEGQIVFTRHVSSPGIKPYEGRGYIAPAIEEFKGTVLPSIDPGIREYVNIAIRKSFPGAGHK